jgi:hypothetical protein
MAHLPMPPYDKLSERLKYDPETGIGTWIVSPGNQVKNQTVAGCYNNWGYLIIRYNYKIYGGHRLFWYLQTKEDPGHFTIDHIDQNKKNNKFCNLRLATPTQQKQNVLITKNNTTGVRGIRWKESMQRYEARIVFNGKRIQLGSFRTFDQAVAVRQAKELELYGEFSPLHRSKNDQRLILDDNDQQLSLLWHPSV